MFEVQNHIVSNGNQGLLHELAVLEDSRYWIAEFMTSTKKRDGEKAYLVNINKMRK